MVSVCPTQSYRSLSGLITVPHEGDRRKLLRTVGLRASANLAPMLAPRGAETHPLKPIASK